MRQSCSGRAIVIHLLQVMEQSMDEIVVQENRRQHQAADCDKHNLHTTNVDRRSSKMGLAEYSACCTNCESRNISEKSLRDLKRVKRLESWVLTILVGGDTS